MSQADADTTQACINRINIEKTPVFSSLSSAVLPWLLSARLRPDVETGEYIQLEFEAKWSM